MFICPSLPSHLCVSWVFCPVSFRSTYQVDEVEQKTVIVLEILRVSRSVSSASPQKIDNKEVLLIVHCSGHFKFMSKIRVHFTPQCLNIAILKLWEKLTDGTKIFNHFRSSRESSHAWPKHRINSVLKVRTSYIHPRKPGQGQSVSKGAVFCRIALSCQKHQVFLL